MMVDGTEDQFFTGERIDPADNAFLTAGGEGLHPEDELGAPEKARKSIPSWKIVGGVMLLVLVGAVGFNLYRGKAQSGSDMPMPDSISQAAPAPIAKAAPSPMPISADPTIPNGVGAPSPTPGNVGAPAPTAAASTAVVTSNPSPGQTPTAPAVASALPATSSPPTAGAPTAVSVVAAAPATQLGGSPVSKDDSEVAELRKRMSALEARVEALTGKKQAAAPSSRSTHSSVAPAQKAPASKKTAAVAAVNRTDQRPALTGLRLRNITEGQAWIEDADGHTTVVGVGDSIAGARITHIVPDAFRVDTDRGPVTFAVTRQ